MEKQWTELTPEEKQEERFKRWLSPPDVKFASPEAEKGYQERVTRFTKAVRLEEPDRVPVMSPISMSPVYLAGTTLRSVMYDYDELRQVWIKFIHKFDMDAYMGPGLIPPGRVLEIVDYKSYRWPGHGLSANNMTYQYNEAEYMKADEYDALIKDPTDFWLRVYMPRIFGAFESFRTLPPLTSMNLISSLSFVPFGAPDVQAALEALLEAGRENLKWQAAVMDCDREALKAGFPDIAGALAFAPFDIIGGTLRGTHGVMLDMFQRPDKLHEAMERITPLIVDWAVASVNASGKPFVPIGLLKGADGFMSEKQYETFYWPTLKKTVLDMVNEGLVPLLFAEGSYNQRLDIIKDLPRASVVWQFDQMDMFRAKEILGDLACIAGNVSTPMLIAGTPREMKEHCRRLIEGCGKGGGYILAAGVVEVANAKPENMLAMMEAAKEYGVYK